MRKCDRACHALRGVPPFRRLELGEPSEKENFPAHQRGRDGYWRGLYLYISMNFRKVTKTDEEGGARVGELSQWCQAFLTVTWLKQKYVANMADKKELSPVAK
jgi:hypothetical protein